MLRHFFWPLCLTLFLAGCNLSLEDDKSSGTDSVDTDPDELSACEIKINEQNNPEELQFVCRRFLGGNTSTTASDSQAFSQKATNIPNDQVSDFVIGNEFFEAAWVGGRGTSDARDGAGPLLNVNACQTCHFRDGRGHAPKNAEDNAGTMLIRLFRPAKENEAHIPGNGLSANYVDEHYGGQIQDRSNQGVAAEARIEITWSEEVFEYDDGTEVALRRPKFELVDLGYGELEVTTRLSPRIASPMIGLGLLENIAQVDIEANADANDANEDGISGEVNYVWDVQQEKLVIGRFGWKAGQPSLHQQGAAAFNGDMGLTTVLFQNENCTDFQASVCVNADNGVNDGEVAEVEDLIMGFVTFYSQHLAVPGRRNVDDENVIAGGILFDKVGCVSCHTTEYTTIENADLPALSQQRIFPYTDMLIHDMGVDLADTQQDGSAAPSDETVEFKASSREWRTAPLWGIGLARTTHDEAGFLHDGRARSPMEAVMWHGGEAEPALLQVKKFNATERLQLEAFLNSL